MCEYLNHFMTLVGYFTVGICIGNWLAGRIKGRK